MSISILEVLEVGTWKKPEADLPQSLIQAQGGKDTWIPELCLSLQAVHRHAGVAIPQFAQRAGAALCGINHTGVDE